MDINLNEKINDVVSHEYTKIQVTVFKTYAMERVGFSPYSPNRSYREGTHNDDDIIQTTLKRYKDDKRSLHAKTELSGISQCLLL